ncbi:unnamed protein product [Closterium sp. NIES-53]
MVDPEEVNPLNSSSSSRGNRNPPVSSSPSQPRVSGPGIRNVTTQQDSTSNVLTMFGSRFSPIEALSRILRATSGEEPTSNGRRSSQAPERANQERHQLLPQWLSDSTDGRQQQQQQQPRQQPRQQSQRQLTHENGHFVSASDSDQEEQHLFHRVVDVAGSPPLSALSLGLSSAFFGSDQPAAPVRRNPGQSPLLASRPVTSSRSATSGSSALILSDSNSETTRNLPGLGTSGAFEGQTGEGPRVTAGDEPRVTRSHPPQLPPLPPPAIAPASQKRAERSATVNGQERVDDCHVEGRGEARARGETRGEGEGEEGQGGDSAHPSIFSANGDAVSGYRPYETPPPIQRRPYDADVAVTSTNGEPFTLRSLTSPPTPSQMAILPASSAASHASPSLLSLPGSVAEGGERRESDAGGEIRLDVDLGGVEGRVEERRRDGANAAAGVGFGGTVEGRGSAGEAETAAAVGAGAGTGAEANAGAGAAEAGAAGLAGMLAVTGTAGSEGDSSETASDAAGEAAALAIIGGRGGGAGRAFEAAEGRSEASGGVPASGGAGSGAVDGGGVDTDGGGRGGGGEGGGEGGSGGGGGGGTVTRGSDMHLAARSLEQAVPFAFLLLFVQVRQHLIGEWGVSQHLIGERGVRQDLHSTIAESAGVVRVGG